MVGLIDLAPSANQPLHAGNSAQQQRASFGNSHGGVGSVYGNASTYGGGPSQASRGDASGDAAIGYSFNSIVGMAPASARPSSMPLSSGWGAPAPNAPYSAELASGNHYASNSASYGATQIHQQQQQQSQSQYSSGGQNLQLQQHSQQQYSSGGSTQLYAHNQQTEPLQLSGAYYQSSSQAMPSQSAAASVVSQYSQNSSYAESASYQMAGQQQQQQHLQQQSHGHPPQPLGRQQQQQQQQPTYAPPPSATAQVWHSSGMAWQSQQQPPHSAQLLPQHSMSSSVVGLADLSMFQPSAATIAAATAARSAPYISGGGPLPSSFLPSATGRSSEPAGVTAAGSATAAYRSDQFSSVAADEAIPFSSSRSRGGFGVASSFQGNPSLHGGIAQRGGGPASSGMHDNGGGDAVAAAGDYNGGGLRFTGAASLKSPASVADGVVADNRIQRSTGGAAAAAAAAPLGKGSWASSHLQKRAAGQPEGSSHPLNEQQPAFPSKPISGSFSSGVPVDVDMSGLSKKGRKRLRSRLRTQQRLEQQQQLKQTRRSKKRKARASLSSQQHNFQVHVAAVARSRSGSSGSGSTGDSDGSDEDGSSSSDGGSSDTSEGDHTTMRESTSAHAHRVSRNGMGEGGTLQGQQPHSNDSGAAAVAISSPNSSSRSSRGVATGMLVADAQHARRIDSSTMAASANAASTSSVASSAVPSSSATVARSASGSSSSSAMSGVSGPTSSSSAQADSLRCSASARRSRFDQVVAATAPVIATTTASAAASKAPTVISQPSGGATRPTVSSDGDLQSRENAAAAAAAAAVAPLVSHPVTLVQRGYADVTARHPRVPVPPPFMRSVSCWVHTLPVRRSVLGPGALRLVNNTFALERELPSIIPLPDGENSVPTSSSSSLSFGPLDFDWCQVAAKDVAASYTAPTAVNLFSPSVYVVDNDRVLLAPEPIDNPTTDTNNDSDNNSRSRVPSHSETHPSSLIDEAADPHGYMDNDSGGASVTVNGSATDRVRTAPAAGMLPTRFCVKVMLLHGADAVSPTSTAPAAALSAASLSGKAAASKPSPTRALPTTTASSIATTSSAAKPRSDAKITAPDSPATSSLLHQHPAQGGASTAATTTTVLSSFSFSSSSSLARCIRFLVLAPSAATAAGRHPSLVLPGGAWLSSLDGGDPLVEDSPLVRAGTRHVREQCGVDLSPCTAWVKFLETHYHHPAVLSPDGQAVLVPEHVATSVTLLCLDAHLAGRAYTPDGPGGTWVAVPDDDSSDDDSDSEHSDAEPDRDRESGSPSRGVASPAAAESTPARDGLMRKPYNDVRAMARARGLDTRGGKKELVDRLLDAAAAAAAAAAGTTTAASAPDGSFANKDAVMKSDAPGNRKESAPAASASPPPSSGPALASVSTTSSNAACFPESSPATTAMSTLDSFSMGSLLEEQGRQVVNAVPPPPPHAVLVVVPPLAHLSASPSSPPVPLSANSAAASTMVSKHHQLRHQLRLVSLADLLASYSSDTGTAVTAAACAPTFETSLCAEALNEMLLRDYGHVIAATLTSLGSSRASNRPPPHVRSSGSSSAGTASTDALPSLASTSNTNTTMMTTVHDSAVTTDSEGLEAGELFVSHSSAATHAPDPSTASSLALLGQAWNFVFGPLKKYPSGDDDAPPPTASQLEALLFNCGIAASRASVRGIVDIAIAGSMKQQMGRDEVEAGRGLCWYAADAARALALN